MYYSSEEEIEDDVSSEEDKIGSGADGQQQKPIIPLERIELGESDTKRIATQRGVIWLSFPETSRPCIDNQFPTSYTSTTSKERLLLLFAENFRRQFSVAFEQRRPLILAVANEAGIQKFVSTTIRSTTLLFADLVGNWEGPAQFVADFIEFEVLRDPIRMPDRLISPDTLLRRRRKGNSFEMATLLCSLLIGNGFRAMVVSGYATREVVNNNQERVACPCIPEVRDDVSTADMMQEPVKKNKFALRDPIDLRSRFELEMAERRAKECEQQKQKQLEEEQKERELLEQLEPDEYHGWRVHAWVVVLPKEKSFKMAATNSEQHDHVFFIEPSTGFRVSPGDPVYLGIESVWDNNNYHVNCQEPIADIASMKWDLSNTDHWQTLLANGGGALQIANDEKIANDANRKYLDMPHSWVVRPHVSNTSFEERFPNGHKSIRYKRAIYDRYQNYFNTNGLMRQLTLYETLDYEGCKLKQWEWYENRVDVLNMIFIDYVKERTVHYFDKGRPDKLKQSTYPDAADQSTEFYFFFHSRVDALEKLECHPKYVREKFGEREDRLMTREFTIETDANGESKMLVQVCETYQRNPKREARDDIAIRRFDLKNGFIRLQFHYRQDEITPTIRIFKRPPKPEYGCEIIYDYEDRNTNQFNKEEHLSKVEQYLLLLEQLRMEEKCQNEFKSRSEFIAKLLKTRNDETEIPALTFSIFDPLRNAAARSMRLSRQEQLERRKELALKTEPDLVAPYLIRYSNRRPTTSESETIMNACLLDIETEYRHVLDELCRAHEDQALEEESLRRFLNKFQRQFEDFEYEMLVKQGERIESNKRVLQQRIDTVRQEFQEKFENVRQSILDDKRLHFHESATEEVPDPDE